MNFGEMGHCLAQSLQSPVFNSYVLQVSSKTVQQCPACNGPLAMPYSPLIPCVEVGHSEAECDGSRLRRNVTGTRGMDTSSSLTAWEDLHRDGGLIRVMGVSDTHSRSDPDKPLTVRTKSRSSHYVADVDR